MSLKIAASKLAELSSFNLFIKHINLILVSKLYNCIRVCLTITIQKIFDEVFYAYIK